MINIINILLIFIYLFSCIFRLICGRGRQIHLRQRQLSVRCQGNHQLRHCMRMVLQQPFYHHWRRRLRCLFCRGNERVEQVRCRLMMEFHNSNGPALDHILAIVLVVNSAEFRSIVSCKLCCSVW